MTKVDRAWTPLASGTILTLRGDTITSEAPGNRPEPVASAMQGKSLADAERAVNQARPDPLAVKYAELPPVARWKTVSQQAP